MMHNTFDGIKGYATYANAMKKLENVFPADMNDRPQTLVAVTPAGRYIPVAVGELALRHGAHWHGIVVVG